MWNRKKYSNAMHNILRNLIRYVGMKVMTYPKYTITMNNFVLGMLNWQIFVSSRNKSKKWMEIYLFVPIIANIWSFKWLRALNFLVIRFLIFGVTTNQVQSIAKSIETQTPLFTRHLNKKEADINLVMWTAQKCMNRSRRSMMVRETVRGFYLLQVSCWMMRISIK